MPKGYNPNRPKPAAGRADFTPEAEAIERDAENQAKLDQCSGPHIFRPRGGNQDEAPRYLCVQCGGFISEAAHRWYRQGADAVAKDMAYIFTTTQGVAKIDLFRESLIAQEVFVNPSALPEKAAEEAIRRQRETVLNALMAVSKL